MDKTNYEVTEDYFTKGNWMIWDGPDPLGETFATKAEALARVKQLERRNQIWGWVIVAIFVPCMLYYFWEHNSYFGPNIPINPDTVETPDNGYDL